MGKTLIVAEKPSQAREYAKTLGVKGRGEGFFQNDQYLITWCIGHLLELNPPEDYMDLNQVGKRWGLHRLPVLPSPKNFKHRTKSSTRSQYQVLVRLLQSPEIDKVICGTDADREGQLLFQEVWDLVRCQKPLQRLWISSLTAEAIREGMSRLRDEGEVQGLAQAGYGRSFGDWDFGMNLTEGFTALFGSFDPIRKKPNVISIGRVQTPTLALVVEREWEIEQFVPLQYCEVEAEFKACGGTYTGKWIEKGRSQQEKETGVGADRQRELEPRLDREKAKEIAAKVQGKLGKIASLEAKEVQEAHPLLFDLTSLTVVASKRFGMSAEQVLKIAQSLYEKKAITYPRTDCNFLPPDILPKLPAHLRALNIEPYTRWVEEAQKKDLPRGKRVINQITAHHAIIPTTEKISPEKLSTEERKLWDLIVRRFLSVWFPPARYETTLVLTQVEGETFQTRGKVLLELGWKKLIDNQADEQSRFGSGEQNGAKRRKNSSKKGEDGEEREADFVALPALRCGESVETLKAAVKEKETKPPKRYTQGDLLKAMENAGKKVEDELLQQQLKGKGLGTVATRPAIIENLLDRGYLVQEQRALHPTEKGKELIRLIKKELPKAQLLVSAEMTGQMEYDLSLVEQGKLELAQYMAQVEKAIREILEELRAFEKTVGKRPLAQAPLKTKGRSAKGPSPSRKGTPTKAALFSEDDNSVNVSSTSDLPNSLNVSNPSKATNSPNSQSQIKSSPDSLGRCPLCGADVVEREKGYGCMNWRQGCPFIVWKNKICGKVLSPTQVKKLLKKGSTDLIKGFRSKTGKSFSAYLIWDELGPGKVKFKFEQK